MNRMENPVAFTVTVATLAVALIGAWFAWQNHRDQRLRALPEIWMHPLDHGLYPRHHPMIVYFQLKVHHPNFGWRVTRVNVVEATPRECLQQGESGPLVWCDSHEFDSPIEANQNGELFVRPGCNDLVLKFLCERQRERRWRRGSTQEKRWVGPIRTSWLLQAEEGGD